MLGVHLAEVLFPDQRGFFQIRQARFLPDSTRGKPETRQPSGRCSKQFIWHFTEKAKSREFGLFVSSPYLKPTSVVQVHGLKNAEKLAFFYEKRRQLVKKVLNSLVSEGASAADYFFCWPEEIWLPYLFPPCRRNCLIARARARASGGGTALET